MIFLPKSQPAPLSLMVEKNKKTGKYNEADVWERLNEDFKNKCYICEIPGPTSINVEHFRPHKNDRDLKFDWNNLFFACVHCNNTKKDGYLGLLNCTIEEDEVDKCISYRLINQLEKEVELKGIRIDKRVDITIDLLEHVYNGNTATKKLESYNLRRQLKAEIADFNYLLEKYLERDFSILSETKLQDLIVDNLKSERGGFTAFKRWIIWDHTLLNEEFGKFCK